MAKVLDKTSKTVLIKLSIQEYNALYDIGLIRDEEKDFAGYEFVFDTPIQASELLKNIK